MSSKKFYLIDGSELKCNMGDQTTQLKVSSQIFRTNGGKPYATEKDNIPNKNIMPFGVCSVTQKKCIPNPGAWEKVPRASIENVKKLYELSQCKCNTGGLIDVKKAGQSFTGEIKSEDEEHIFNTSNKNSNDYVEDAYWIDRAGNKISLAGEYDTVIYFFIKFKPKAIGCYLALYLYDNIENVPDPFVDMGTVSCTVSKLSQIFSYDAKKLNAPSGPILNLYADLWIDYQDNKLSYPTHKADYLKINLIRFVPAIEQALGWPNAKLLQDIWFAGASNSEPWNIPPKTNLIDINWVLKYPRMKERYDKIINGLWNNEAAIRELKAQINSMVTDKIVQLPTIAGQVTAFGTFDDKIGWKKAKQPKLDKAVKDEQMPAFERYYYQSLQYEISKNIFSPEPVDEMLGALASCQFRVIAKGTLTRLSYKSPVLFGIGELNYTKVTIQKIGIYIKDSFDFIHGGEYLGDWSPTANKAGYSFIQPSPGYIPIHNKDYNDWKKDYKKGMDYTLYSTVKEVAKHFEFTL